MAKKKDSFEKKFKDVILSYPDKNRFRFVKAMKEIAKIAEHSISNGEYGKFCPKMEKKLSKALEICKDYEMNCDAVENLKQHAFNKKNCSSIHTVKCPKWEDFKKEMSEHLEELPKRGFVYIAWRLNPSFVFYIGKTESDEGERILELTRHNTLTRAIEKGATQFTIIFPSNSVNIGNVEGSFIRIIETLGYELLNLKPQSFNPWEGELSKLEKFFGEMQKKVRRYNKE